MGGHRGRKLKRGEADGRRRPSSCQIPFQEFFGLRPVLTGAHEERSCRIDSTDWRSPCCRLAPAAASVPARCRADRLRLRRRDWRFMEAADPAEHRQAALRRLPGFPRNCPGDRRLPGANYRRRRPLGTELHRHRRCSADRPPWAATLRLAPPMCRSADSDLRPADRKWISSRS